MTTLDVDDLLRSGVHLPDVLRGFHAQKDVFRAMHEIVEENPDDLVKRPDWITGQCYVIDVFLRFMARRGYFLQRTRRRGDFRDLKTDVQLAMRSRDARAALDRTSDPVAVAKPAGPAGQVVPAGLVDVPRGSLAGLNAASQCRLLGIQVGQTIEGLEGRQEVGGHWSLARLTLLWLGESSAVWRVTERSSRHPEWSEPRESAAWTLEWRQWRLVAGLDAPAPPTPPTPPTPGARA